MLNRREPAIACLSCLPSIQQKLQRLHVSTTSAQRLHASMSSCDNVGGAMELAQQYKHFFTGNRVRSATNYQAAGPTAQQLSYQRALKHATSDSVAHDHLVRLEHMFRRVASPSASPYQQQQQRSAQQSPPPQQQQLRGAHRLRPGSVTAGLCPWPTGHAASSSELRRPSTAPEQRSSSTPPQQTDWQQLKAAAHPQPRPPIEPATLPPSRYYPGPNLLPSVQQRLFKATLYNDILTRQLYKAADIRQACVGLIHNSAAEHRDALRKVAAEVLHELGVPYTTQLDS